MMFVWRKSRSQGGRFQLSARDRSRNSFLFEICRIEHPDDAIVKISVRIFSRMVSTAVMATDT